MYTFEARAVQEGNEYSVGNSLEKAGIITGAVVRVLMFTAICVTYYI
jgi:hypothetical protein